MEINFSPLYIIDPELSFSEFNVQPRKVTVKALVYAKNKGGTVIINKYITDNTYSNYMLITGYFQFLHPYVVYTCVVDVNKKYMKGIGRAKLKSVLKYELFNLEDKIYYKPAETPYDANAPETSLTTINCAVYDYVFSEEFKWNEKVELKNKKELEQKYLDIFKCNKTCFKKELLNTIFENDSLKKTFFESTLYLQTDESVIIYELFCAEKINLKSPKNATIQMLGYEEWKNIDNHVNNLDCKLLLTNNFIFGNNLSLKSLSCFLERWSHRKYNSSSTDNLSKFLVCGLVLIAINEYKEGDHISMNDLRDLVNQHLLAFKKISKSINTSDTTKSAFFDKVRNEIKSIVLSDHINEAMFLLIKEDYIYTFEMETGNTFIYLKTTYNDQKTICDALCQIQNNLIQYTEEILNKKKTKKIFGDTYDALIKDKTLNERQGNFFCSVGEYDFSFYLLKGMPGTGKTTTILHTVQSLLQIEGSNILLTSFQGSTKDNLMQKVNKKLFPSKQYVSAIGTMTIHKFLSKLSFMETQVEETTDSVLDLTNFYSIEEESTETFREYYKRLKIVIIDEFSNVDVGLFAQLMSKIRDRAIKVIMVGDEKQCVSFNSLSLIDEFYKFISDKKSSNVVELVDNNRFNDQDGHISKNIELVYSGSQSITSEFGYGEGTSVELISYSNSPIKKCKEIIKNNEKTKTELFTFLNKDVEAINQSIFTLGFMRMDCTKESIDYDKEFKNLLYDDYEAHSIIKLGNKILNKSNANAKTIKNCYIFKSGITNGVGEIFAVLNYISSKLKSEYCRKDGTCFKHTNTYSFFKKIDEEISSSTPFLLNLEDCVSEYIANGTGGYIVDIKYGMQFIEMDPSKKKVITGKTYKQITKTHWASDIKIVTILTNELDLDGNQKTKRIVLGKNAVDEKNIEIGFCKTIDSIQGMEFDVGIFIIPNLYFNKMNESFFCSNRLVVALSRSKKKVYILVNSDINVNLALLSEKKKSKWIQAMLNTNVKTYTPLQVIQHMTLNQPNKKKTKFLLLLNLNYSSKVENKKTNDDENPKKKKKIN